jgi:alpha-galactosidase
MLQSLAATFPVPESANELLDTYGRHLRERAPQRHAFTVGKHERESRRGRPGADATLLQVVGAKGFGFERGVVHAVHLAWSGNHRLIAEKGPSYPPFIQVSDLLLPGEGLLQPGETYTTPKAIGSWGDGLSAMSHRFHAYVRALPGYPKSTRPVMVNTWEAVYFSLDFDKLVSLAKTAAAAGAERFILDDGWFKGRRGDTAGLGDWFVDKDVFPNGLQPLWDEVDKAGLQCGLWFEPEMVNLNSDLARAHPDWILRPTADRLPVPGRQQYVLDLSNPDVFAYIFKCIDDLLTEYKLIKYIKWDHNRDLVEPSSALASYRAAVRANVLAVYRLMDKLKKAHPELEIESCASGGARVDLGILERTDRIWTSDCTDPLERLTIQKYTSLVVPPELMGAHIGPPESHTTGRTHKLDLRAGVPLLCHLGIEWDLTSASSDDQAAVKQWIDLHKKWRDVIHSGNLVFVDDTADEHADVRGVVAKDQSRGIFTFTQVRTAASYPPPKFRLCGLDPSKRYKVSLLYDLSFARGGAVGQSALQWAGGVTLSGKALDLGGLATLTIEPERLYVVEVEAQ